MERRAPARDDALKSGAISYAFLTSKAAKPPVTRRAKRCQAELRPVATLARVDPARRAATIQRRCRFAWLYLNRLIGGERSTSRWGFPFLVRFPMAILIGVKRVLGLAYSFKVG